MTLRGMKKKKPKQSYLTFNMLALYLLNYPAVNISSKITWQKINWNKFHTIIINYKIEHAKSHFSHFSQSSLKSNTAFCWSISVLI